MALQVRDLRAHCVQGALLRTQEVPVCDQAHTRRFGQPCGGCNRARPADVPEFGKSLAAARAAARADARADAKDEDGEEEEEEGEVEEEPAAAPAATRPRRGRPPLPRRFARPGPVIG